MAALSPLASSARYIVGVKNICGFGSDLVQLFLPDGLSAELSCNAGDPDPAKEGLFKPYEQVSFHRRSLRLIHTGAQRVPNLFTKSLDSRPIEAQIFISVH